MKCGTCRAYLRGDRRHVTSEVYDLGKFADRIQVARGDTPSFDDFDSLAPSLKSGSLLEIGCGTGHLLAAAKQRGFEVAGIELSPYQREYIRRKWGISTSAEAVESSSYPDESFDNVLSTNVFEHIADPYQHLLAIRRLLKPGGRCVISTANADCIVARLFGVWWAMFKPEDHVSIPSKKSLKMLGQQTGLSVFEVWCSEYPLETPVGIAIAMRDRIRSMKSPSTGHSESKEGIQSSSNLSDRVRGLRHFRFVSDLFSRLMIAGSIKVIYEKPPADSSNRPAQTSR